MSRRIAVAVALTVGLAACSQGNVFTLEEGTCFDEFSQDDGGEVSDVPVVDCAEPHDNEVYATFELPDGDFPGQEEATAQAEEGCLGRFEEFVGTVYADSRYVVSSLTPTEGSWSDGDREVVCFLYDSDLQKLEGSAEGTAQ